MNRETSLYLDLWRFLLAMEVFLGHVSGVRFTGGLLWQIEPYTVEAVAVFFVLSGFVIGYVTDQREQSPSSYVIARAARIYSVAIPALAATYVLDNLGRAARPDLYSAVWGYAPVENAWQLLGGMFFLSGLWGTDMPWGSDLSYWSLGYEVWYYVIFGIILFAPALWRLPAVIVALAIVGPATALLFPLWLLGVYGYRVCCTQTFGRATGWALFLAPMPLWIAYEYLARLHGRFVWLTPVPMPHPELLQDYVVGLLFLVHVIGFRVVSPTFKPMLARFAGPIRWAAGATFTIYLFHLPIAQFLTTLLGVSPFAWSARLIVIVGTTALLFAIAELTERRKNLWRRAFEGVWLHLRPQQAR